MPLDYGPEELRRKAAAAIGLTSSNLISVRLLRQSVDARKKPQIRYNCAVGVEVENEENILRLFSDGNVSKWVAEPYIFPPVTRRSTLPPVIVGMGPAGLFAALFLARNGIPSVILERGQPVEQRTKDVSMFWTEGRLNPASNVQFGEGGAGTFSDGKLTTNTHDHRIGAVLQEFVAHGAPEVIP